ncbi:JDVT-CTERM system glutamic-type intramembrane protease [Ideonella sp. DXS29W]|uniref:JDVT-CTERM system glutamic-type intramembrane protease n=1 Tax=Ideonella lacteola TaxID=2984193 RepID=A0ABU9C0D3_9BURK
MKLKSATLTKHSVNNGHWANQAPFEHRMNCLHEWRLCILLAAVGFGLDPSKGTVESLLLAPIFEEIVFREGLHAWWRRQTSAHVAVCGVAAVFSSMHWLWASPYAASWMAPATFFPAVWIGYVYEKTRSVSTCSAWHSFFNFVWRFGAMPLLQQN